MIEFWEQWINEINVANEEAYKEYCKTFFIHKDFIFT